MPSDREKPRHRQAIRPPAQAISAVAQVPQVLAEIRVGKRIASRLAGMCIGVALDGPDYRLGGEQ